MVARYSDSGGDFAELLVALFTSDSMRLRYAP